VNSLIETELRKIRVDPAMFRLPSGRRRAESSVVRICLSEVCGDVFDNQLFSVSSRADREASKDVNSRYRVHISDVMDSHAEKGKTPLRGAIAEDACIYRNTAVCFV